jgi:urease accessory protein
MAALQENMPTELGLQRLRLLQLFDSQFPVGAFAHSGGLETYAQAGAGLATLRELLISQLDLGWGRSDLVAACLAWRAAAGTGTDRDLPRLAALLDACKVIPSVRNSSVKLGRRTLNLLRRLYPETLRNIDMSSPHHAVVVGVIGYRLDLPLRDLLLSYAHSLALGVLAAATRCMPVSPAQTQALLRDLQPRLLAAVERALTSTEDALFTCTPALDVRCHQQTLLHTRLFQS